MGRPWNRIALDFVVGIASLVAAHQLRRLVDEDANGDPVRLRPGWAVAGALSSIGWGYAYDADVWGLRTDRKRRAALTVGWSVLAHRVLPADGATTYSVSIGTGLGTLCYRCWFGLVRPIRPGFADSEPDPADSE